MAPETLRDLDLALLRCGALASALRHPNREHPPNPSETARLDADLERALRDLQARIAAALPG